MTAPTEAEIREAVDSGYAVTAQQVGDAIDAAVDRLMRRLEERYPAADRREDTVPS